MNLSPDGYFYMAMARGEHVPRPYARRWLVPWLLGDRPGRWAALTYASLGLTPALGFGYFGTMGLGLGEQIFATLLLCALPGVWRCSLWFPVLLDACSFALALGCAWAVRSDYLAIGAALALIGGATRETVPVFAAVWAWHPVPLAGLLAVGWLRRAAPPSDAVDWLATPFRAALDLRWKIGLDPTLYLRPLGGALAGFAVLSWQVAVATALAFGQLLAAQDTIRLTIWCAPVLAASAARALPSAWWVLALVWTVVQSDQRA